MSRLTSNHRAREIVENHLQSIGATILNHNHNHNNHNYNNNNDRHTGGEGQKQEQGQDDEGGRGGGQGQGGQEGRQGRGQGSSSSSSGSTSSSYIVASAPVRVWEALLATRFFVLNQQQPPPRPRQQQPQPPQRQQQPQPQPRPESLSPSLARQTGQSHTQSFSDTAATSATSPTTSADRAVENTTTTTTTADELFSANEDVAAARELLRCHSYSLPAALTDHVAFVFNTGHSPPPPSPHSSHMPINVYPH